MGGNANPYDYCTQDPINCFDLDGRWGFKKWWKKHAAAIDFVQQTLDTFALVGCGVCAGASVAISAVNFAVDASDHHWGSAALDGLGFVPGGSRLVARGGEAFAGRAMRNAARGAERRAARRALLRVRHFRKHTSRYLDGASYGVATFRYAMHHSPMDD